MSTEAALGAPRDRRRHLWRLRETNARRIAKLDLPSPCDIATLCRQLGRQRNRPIMLVPMPLPAPHPCGMWAAAQDEDLIFFDSSTTSTHQEHIILHEFGHIIRRHRGGDLRDEDSVRGNFPNLSPALVQGMLARAGYDNVDEQEAEIIAYLLRERMQGSAARPTAGRPEDKDALSRIERTLARDLPSRNRFRSATVSCRESPRSRTVVTPAASIWRA